MDLKRFKTLSEKYKNTPQIISDLDEYEEYAMAFHEQKECTEWELKQRTKRAKIDYKKYCCLEMASQLIEYKLSINNEEGLSSDATVMHTRGRKEFGILIHDGTDAYFKINFCPWCGKRL